MSVLCKGKSASVKALPKKGEWILQAVLRLDKSCPVFDYENWIVMEMTDLGITRRIDAVSRGPPVAVLNNYSKARAAVPGVLFL